MQQSDIQALLALHRTPNLPDSVLRLLLAATDTPCAIYQLNADELISLGIPPAARQALREPINQRQLEQDCALLEQFNIQLIALGSSLYPALLSEISDPPPILYLRGNARLLNQPQLAMVGSRHASRQGLENAYRFASELSHQGFTITSGMALGIDTECHRGALAGGKTLAVLGTGVDIVYPARNHQLAEEIIERGALLSEFPLATGPRRSLFPKRNRLISGMSLGVLVVEAALQSGSLITARCALEQGREVYAIPGSIHGTASRGCHAMIRQGAKLVETAADILDELQGWMPRATPLPTGGSPVRVECSDSEQALLDWLAFDPATIDLLQQRSSWTAAEIITVLTTLELKGLVENRGGCYQQIAGAKAK